MVYHPPTLWLLQSAAIALCITSAFGGSYLEATDFREAAEIFPLDEEKIAALAEDIRKHGQQVPTKLFAIMIINGRRRSKACGVAGLDPKFRDVTPSNPIAYVVSLNLRRRQSTVPQLAMLGARVREIYDSSSVLFRV